MNKIAIAFSTKDRVELSRQSIEPLLQPDRFDLHWSDGSSTHEGEAFFDKHCGKAKHAYANVTGGADAAIAFNLTMLLAAMKTTVHSGGAGFTVSPLYDFVGLVENDVLLDPDWFDETMMLFSEGERDGLEVGAVSARCYEDRILIQRDGYAVMHNLGAGMTIFSRKAAELVLKYFRTGWTMENRRVFAQLSGRDIGPYWAFGGNAHMLCADWQFDRVLSQHGLSSLALTPAKCTMIGQVPPLAEQGLTLASGSVEQHRDDAAFELYANRTARIRANAWQLPPSLFLANDDGTTTVFPHQIPYLGGRYAGDWKLRWAQGMGPFAWKAGWDGKSNIGKPFSENISRMSVPISGPCVLLVSGGERGGKVRVNDAQSGYDVRMDIAAEGPSGQVMQIQVPAAVSYREVTLTALTPGVTFYGIVCQERQPTLSVGAFDHTWLPAP